MKIRTHHMLQTHVEIISVSSLKSAPMPSPFVYLQVLA